VFDSEPALRAWRDNPEHLNAQALGRERFYEEYRVTVSTAGRRYTFSRAQGRRELTSHPHDG
jgi:heme-degrading monooxygenase HmoA